MFPHHASDKLAAELLRCVPQQRVEPSVPLVVERDARPVVPTQSGKRGDLLLSTQFRLRNAVDGADTEGLAVLAARFYGEAFPRGMQASAPDRPADVAPKDKRGASARKEAGIRRKHRRLKTHGAHI